MADLIETTDVEENPTEAPAEEVVEAPQPTSPYDLPGDWYVIHSYSGYENKVKVEPGDPHPVDAHGRPDL